MANGDVAMQTSTAPAVHGETQLTASGQQSSAAAPEPAKYHGRYRQLAVLGQGTFGVVIRAVDDSASPPEEVAIKLLPRGSFIKDFKTYVKREILHQSSLKHPFIVGLKEVFTTPSHLAIAMEFAQGGDLFKYVLRHKPRCQLSESQSRWLFQQLVIGLDYCHCRGVANRDLKLENLLLDQDGSDGKRPLLKICDFGYSKHEMNSSAKSGVGTPIYMAPEIVYGGTRYDAKRADIWSCGVILFAMLYGRYPFNAKDKDYMRKIVTAQYEMPEDVQISPNCRDMLTQLLVAKPEARLSLEQIRAHPWFLYHLPQGALDMNSWYLQTQPNLDRHAAKIEQILNQAIWPNRNEEVAISVTF